MPTYRLFHNNGDWRGRSGKAVISDDQLVHVANVEADKLSEVYALCDNDGPTNRSEWDGEVSKRMGCAHDTGDGSPWTHNPKVEFVAPDRTIDSVRSMMTGDVVEDPEGIRWYCDMVGWRKLDEVNAEVQAKAK